MPAQSPFPVQKIPRSTSAQIEDKKGKLVALGALVRYTNNQAYFILQHLDASFADKAVTVSAPDDQKPLNMRIDAIFDQHPNRAFLPMYIQVHFNPEERLVLEHLVDQLAETTLGRHNLELRKNLTIDVFDSDRDSFLRDNAGFFVADRLRFQQLTANVKEALAALKPSKEVVVSRTNGEQHKSALVEYDATLSSHHRADFLKFLFDKNQVYVAEWTAEKLEREKKAASDKEAKEQGTDSKKASVAGYLVGSMDTLFCIYAENQAIADALLAKYMAEAGTDTVSLCTVAGKWPNLSGLKSLKVRPIYRRHTRAVPSNIKFDRVFGINVGLNIF